jgi:hypothetical protein
VHRLVLLCVTLTHACSGPPVRRMGPDDAAPVCGDGVLDPTEACDGSNLRSARCQDFGFDEGTVSCTATCSISTNACIRRCGNGILDATEACDGPRGVPVCSSFGAVRCVDCQLDRSGCVNPGLQPGPVMSNAKGGPATIGDVGGRGPNELVMVVPGFGRLEIFSWVAGQGFDAVGSRKLSFDQQPRQARVAELNGDTLGDILALNDDGSIDAYLAQGASFTRRRAFDAGCFEGTFVFVADAGVALGCKDEIVSLRGVAVHRQPIDGGVVAALNDGDGGVSLAWVGGNALWSAPLGALGSVTSAPFPTTEVRELAFADFDDDTDADVVARTTLGLVPIENTGSGWAVRPLWPAPMAQGLWASDIDLDGRPDVVSMVGDSLVVRRNEGNWVFSSHVSQALPGRLVSLSVGDVDGDGDVDFALTLATTGEATRTATVLNRVR